MLVDIGNEDPEWGAIEEEMQSTIRLYNYTCVIISSGGDLSQRISLATISVSRFLDEACFLFVVKIEQFGVESKIILMLVADTR